MMSRILAAIPDCYMPVISFMLVSDLDSLVVQVVAGMAYLGSLYCLKHQRWWAHFLGIE